LATGISWVLENGDSLRGHMRVFAEERFLPETIARAYRNVYGGVLEKSH